MGACDPPVESLYALSSPPSEEEDGLSGDAEAQAVYILDKIGAAIEALGGELEDEVRTRVLSA